MKNNRLLKYLKKDITFASCLKKYKNSISISPIRHYIDEKGDFYIEYREEDVKKLLHKYKVNYANI